MAAQAAMVVHAGPCQVGYLRLGETDPDAIVVDSGHSSDRDADLLLAPQVTFVKEKVRYLVATWVDDEPTDVPNWTVGCVDALSPHLDFS
jgi:hypothetical protein